MANYLGSRQKLAKTGKLATGLNIQGYEAKRVYLENYSKTINATAQDAVILSISGRVVTRTEDYGVYGL